MARYIKANPKVADYLNLKNDRNTVSDGNYLLWQNDMLAFGSLTELPDILTAIGAIALMPHEAREEQDGTVTRPLPIATDERFIIVATEPEETPAPVEDEPETTEPDDNGETPGEHPDTDNEPEPSEEEAEAPNADADEATVEEPENTTNESTEK